MEELCINDWNLFAGQRETIANNPSLRSILLTVAFNPPGPNICMRTAEKHILFAAVLRFWKVVHLIKADGYADGTDFAPEHHRGYCEPLVNT